MTRIMFNRGRSAKRISRGEKSRLGLCSTEVGAQTFLRGKNRDIFSPSRFISPRCFCLVVWRGALCFHFVTKAALYNFFPPPQKCTSFENAPSANKGCHRPSASALWTSVE